MQTNEKSQLQSGSGSDALPCSVSAGVGYRLLEAGERLQKHDEGLHEEDGKWHEIGWLFAACDYVPGFMVPIRRKCEHCTQGYVQDAGFVECNHCNSPQNAGGMARELATQDSDTTTEIDG